MGRRCIIPEVYVKWGHRDIVWDKYGIYNLELRNRSGSTVWRFSLHAETDLWLYDCGENCTKPHRLNNCFGLHSEVSSLPVWAFSSCPWQGVLCLQSGLPAAPAGAFGCRSPSAPQTPPFWSVYKKLETRWSLYLTLHILSDGRNKAHVALIIKMLLSHIRTKEGEGIFGFF